MNKEQKIEALSNEIRKALPYLMELSEGCIFFNHKKGYFKAHHIRIIGHFDLSRTHLITACVEGNSSANFYYPLSCELVGKEPMLNDVLAWLAKVKEDRGVLITAKGEMCFYDDEILDLFIMYNLEKPYLKDQSEELINFLYSLIQK